MRRHINGRHRAGYRIAAPDPYDCFFSRRSQPHSVCADGRMQSDQMRRERKRHVPARAGVTHSARIRTQMPRKAFVADYGAVVLQLQAIEACRSFPILAEANEVGATWVEKERHPLRRLIRHVSQGAGRLGRKRQSRESAPPLLRLLRFPACVRQAGEYLRPSPAAGMSLRSMHRSSPQRRRLWARLRTRAEARDVRGCEA